MLVPLPMQGLQFVTGMMMMTMMMMMLLLMMMMKLMAAALMQIGQGCARAGSEGE